MTIYATATFHDCWAGDVKARLVRYRTGYRWIDPKGASCGGLKAKPYTLASMLAIGSWHRCFSNVVPVVLTAEAA